MGIDRKITRIIVLCPDRLTRFGFSTLESFCTSFGGVIDVMNDDQYTTQYTTPQGELVQDLIMIITHFSGTS